MVLILSVYAYQRKNAKLAGVQGMQEMIEETKMAGSEIGGLTSEQELFQSKKIIDREDDYHKRRLNRGQMLSPERQDFFA
mgnify:CR=1 FL=1